MVSLILLCVFLLFVAIGAAFGLARGMNKSLIRFGTFLIAILFTFFVSGIVTNLVAENVVIKGQTLGELLLDTINNSDEMVAGFMAAAPLLQEAILVAPAFAIGIVAFPLVFILLSFITWIVYLCIQRPLRGKLFKETFKKDKKTEDQEQPEEKKSMGVRVGKRFAGMGIGIVSGVLVFGMLFAPLFAVIGMLPENSALNEMIDTLVEQEVLEADIAETIKEELKARDKFVIKAYSAIGMTGAGKLYLSSVSKFEYDGHRTNIPGELDPIFSAAQVLVDGGLLKAILDSDNPNAIFTVLANKEVVDELIGEMFKSKLLCSAVPEVLAMAMESLAISMKVPANKEAVYNNMMDDIADAVKNADIDYAAIKAYEEAQVAADYVALDSGEAPEIMTEEEYNAEIQKLTDLTLKISKIINIAVSGSDETVAHSIADQIVKNVKTDVVENGADVASFGSDSVKVVISNLSADGSAQAVLEKMSNPAKFETNVTTVETITNSIRETVKEAVADPSKAEETAGALSGAVSSFAGAVESAIGENGTVDIAKLDFGKIAEGVTGLQNSTLKDVGSSVLDLVAAGDLGGNAMVGDVIGAIKDSYDSGENISGAINSAGALIVIGTTMGNGNGEGSKDTIANSFADLVQHLDETTMKLLPNILTEDLLKSLGVAEDYIDLVYDVVETLLNELMKLKGAEDYSAEVDAVLEIYDLAMGGVNTFGEEDIRTLIDSAMKSDAIYNTVIVLGDSGKVLFKIETEDQREFMIDAIEDYYEESEKTDKERKLFTAFATAIGLDKDIELK